VRDVAGVDVLAGDSAMTKQADVDFRLHDDLISDQPFDLEKTAVIFTVCGRGELHRKAFAASVLAWRKLESKIKPSTAIMIYVNGYDDDPRELWNIPEVCDFVQRFCVKTRAHEHPALDPMSRNVLLACGANPGQRVKVNMITVAQAMQQSDAFFKTRK
jgi:hypothetical protein